jgi:hypothetical protein
MSQYRPLSSLASGASIWTRFTQVRDVLFQSRGCWSAGTRATGSLRDSSNGKSTWCLESTAAALGKIQKNAATLLRTEMGFPDQGGPGSGRTGCNISQGLYCVVLCIYRNLWTTSGRLCWSWSCFHSRCHTNTSYLARSKTLIRAY